MNSDSPQVIGLDIGTSRFVTARKEHDGYRCQSQLNAFVNIPYSRLTENSLRLENVPFSRTGAELTVFGNEAARFADLLGVEVRRPMTRGVLNPTEPESLSQVEGLVRSLLGAPGEDAGGDGAGPRKVCFSVPAPQRGSEEGAGYHETSIRQMLAGLHCDAVPVNEGMAVVYAELQDTNFTGVGVSCGGGLCNVALSYMSVPVLSFSTAKGGDYIDAGAAAVTGELSNRIRITKESAFHFNGHYAEKVMQALTVYYDDLIQSVIQGLKDAFLASRGAPRITRPIPLVLSGGSAMPGGFRDRFAQRLEAAALPVSFSEVRLASDPLTSTARGALVAGLAE